MKREKLSSGKGRGLPLWRRPFALSLAPLFLALLALSLCPPLLSGASAAPLEQAANWKHLVNQDYTHALAVQGSALWQGINGGLLQRSLYAPAVSRYYHKLNSGLQGAQVFCVALDGQGGLWAGTEQGAFYRDGRGNWSSLHTGNSPLSVNTVRAVLPDDRGGVWFGTWLGGAYYRDRENAWTAYNRQNSGIAGNRIYSIALDGRGGVWFGTDSRGAAYLDAGGNWTVYNAMNSPLPANDVQEVLVDGEGRVWFATPGGLACLDGAGRWEVYHTQNSPLPSDMVNALALDGQSSLWVGTMGGLACLQRGAGGGAGWRVFTTANSPLPGSMVRSVAVDEGGTVWAGTWGGGLAGFNPEVFTWRVYRHGAVELAGRSYLPSHAVHKLLPFPGGSAEGAVWFATGAGVVYYDAAAAKWERLGAVPGGLPGGFVSSLARDSEGKMAFALDGAGLALRDAAGAWRHYHEENSPLPSNDLVDLAYDAAGGLWVITMGGRAVYLPAGSPDGEGWRLYQAAQGGLPGGEYRLNSVYVDGAGHVWFGTWGSGALCLDGAGNWRAYRAGRYGLPTNDVSRVVADGAGNVWFGTWGGGVARLDSAGNFSLFNRDNSALPSDIVRDLALDKRGWLWAATPGGAAYFDPEKGSWQAVRAENSGLPHNDIWHLAADALGNVWFVTLENGVAVYNPAGFSPALAALGEVTEREQEPMVFFSGRYLQSEVPPLREGGRLLLPLRPLAEALGAALTWDRERGRVELALGEKKVELRINDTRAYVGGELYTLDVPARLHGGRTMVPVRFVSEALGLRVTWDGAVGAALLTKPQ